MTDENKDIENNKEENHNIPEYNKNWWKFVGLWETIHFSQNQRFRKKQSTPTNIIFSFVIVSEAMI